MSLNNKRKNKVQHDIKEQETAVSQEEAKQNAKAEEVLRKVNEEKEEHFSQESGGAASKENSGGRGNCSLKKGKCRAAEKS